MNLDFIIIGSLIIDILAMVIVYILKYNDFQFVIIKISESENNIDILLEKKLELFSRAISIVKDNDEKYVDEGILDKINRIKHKKLNNFEFNDELKKIEKEFCEIIDLDKNLLTLDSLNKIRFEMTDVANDLNAAIKYYNQNVVSYNKLIKCFPSNLVGLSLKLKIKNFYSEEKEEIFEILKKK